MLPMCKACQRMPAIQVSWRENYRMRTTQHWWAVVVMFWPVSWLYASRCTRGSPDHHTTQVSCWQIAYIGARFEIIAASTKPVAALTALPPELLGELLRSDELNVSCVSRRSDAALQAQSC